MLFRSETVVEETVVETVVEEAIVEIKNLEISSLSEEKKDDITLEEKQNNLLKSNISKIILLRRFKK